MMATWSILATIRSGVYLAPGPWAGAKIAALRGLSAGRKAP
jgi:hypothetical protein